MECWQYDCVANTTFLSFTYLLYCLRNSRNHPTNSFQQWLKKGTGNFTFVFPSWSSIPVNLTVAAKHQSDFYWTLSQWLCNHCCTVQRASDKRETRALSFEPSFDVSPSDCLQPQQLLKLHLQRLQLPLLRTGTNQPPEHHTDTPQCIFF